MFIITTKYRRMPEGQANKINTYKVVGEGSESWVSRVVDSEEEVLENVAARLEDPNVEWFKVTPL